MAFYQWYRIKECQGFGNLVDEPIRRLISIFKMCSICIVILIKLAKNRSRLRHWCYVVEAHRRGRLRAQIVMTSSSDVHILSQSDNELAYDVKWVNESLSENATTSIERDYPDVHVVETSTSLAVSRDRRKCLQAFRSRLPPQSRSC